MRDLAHACDNGGRGRPPSTHDISRSGGPAASRAASAGFTLIEVVSVLAIVSAMLAIVLGAYAGWARAGNIGAAANLVSSALDHAREQAITQRRVARIVCQNVSVSGRPATGQIELLLSTNEPFDAAAAFVPFAPRNVLPPAVCFQKEQSIDFGPDGAAAPFDDPSTLSDAGIALTVLAPAGSAGRALSRTVRVNRVTGLNQVEDRP